MDGSLWFFLALVVLATPVLAIASFIRTLSLQRQIEEIRSALAARPAQPAALTPTPAPPASIAPEAPPLTPRPVFVAAPPDDRAFQPPPPWQPQPPAPPREDLENALTSRWMVWLGALAIALAGVFLVKYAIDNQLLTPAARIVLGLVLGIGLAIAGEVLRRRPLQRAIAAVRPDHVPPALTASGLFVAFASIYSAYGIYALIGPLAAFAGLAVIALLGVGLSLLQGRFVALMGLLGAFTAPILVETPHPSVLALFVYLLVVELACLAVARYRHWWWYALATLAGVAAWPLLWLAGPNGDVSDGLPLSLFLLVSAAAFVYLRTGFPAEEGEQSWVDGFRRMGMPTKTTAIAEAVIGTVLFFVGVAAEFSTATLVVSGLVFALYLYAGRSGGFVDILAAIAAVVAIFFVAAIPVSAAIAPLQPLMHAPLVPVELASFALTAALFGALFAVSGFVALWGAERPAVWAGVSAGVPVAFLAIAYWRVVDFGVDVAWAAVAVALAAVMLFAAERVERYRQARGLEVSLGFYAAAVAASIGLAAAMTLREAWLSVALALELPALGFIARLVPARAIRVIAVAVVAVVIARLMLNYNVLGYPLTGGVNWIVYGYGIPALSCFIASREFARGGRDVLVTALEAAGLAFAVLLISLEIRVWAVGSLAADRYPLLEQALQSIAWLSVGSVLAMQAARRPNIVARYGSRFLLGLAAAQIVLLQLLADNPLWSGEAIGAYPVFNVLSFAYLVPAVFALALAARLPESEAPWPWLRGTAAILGFVLVFADVSLEIRRAFHGAVLTTPSQGDAELYSYSAAWLIYSVVLLVLGLLWRVKLVRYAALTVMMVTVVKVFLMDMGDLTGLYRVASFLGLGLSLVGIGYLYQRLVTAGPTDG